jgi:hypothetical protein
MFRLRSLLGLVSKGPDRRAGRSPRPAAFRPTLEALEARETPSSLAHTTDSSGFLFGSGGGKGQGDIDNYVEVVGHGHNATVISIGL